MPKVQDANAFAAAAIAIALSGAIVAPSFAQTTSQAAPTEVPDQPSATTATYGDWVLRCAALQNTPDEGQTSENGQAATQSCEVVLTLQIQGQAQPAAQIAFGFLPGKSEMILTTVLPVNVSIPSTIRILASAQPDVDTSTIDLNWRRCIPGACFADARPSDRFLDALLSEPIGQLQFANALGQLISLPLSSRGLNEALAALEKKA